MPDLSMTDVKNRMRAREALRRLGEGVEQVRGDELVTVADALCADADALDSILGRARVVDIVAARKGQS